MANRASALLQSKVGAASQLRDTAEDYNDDDTKASAGMVRARVARTGYGTVTLYKLTPWGQERIEVAVQSVYGGEGVLSGANAHNYSEACFDCGRADCDPLANNCPAVEPRMYRLCPNRTCSKRIFDPKPKGAFLKDAFDHSDRRDDDDPNVIRDEVYDMASTPESRTKMLMDEHIRAYHPDIALQIGIVRPAELPLPARVG